MRMNHARTVGDASTICTSRNIWYAPQPSLGLEPRSAVRFAQPATDRAVVSADRRGEKTSAEVLREELDDVAEIDRLIV